MEQRKLTNSMRSKFNACHRAYKIAYVDLIRPAKASDALTFGTAMHGEVLEAGGSMSALQPFHAGHTHHCGEVGVLAVGLHAAAPAWVAEDVDVGREECYAGIVAILACFL